MPSRRAEPARGAPRDVRERGFTDRVSLQEALAWLDRHAAPLAAELVAVRAGAGRVCAIAIAAPGPLPPADRAADDGYAVRASDTLGASPYSPLSLALRGAAPTLRPGEAAPVHCGAPLPAGADAVLPFSAAERAPAGLEVVGAIADGAGVLRAGHELAAGAPLLRPGRRLGPEDVALLAALGLERAAVVRRPRVRIVVAGPKGEGARDADGPLLSALVARDGGEVVEVVERAAERGLLGPSLAAPGADAVLVAGRTGTGADDEAPRALAAAGELSLHGVALRPGGSAGMGVAGAVPVLLLPGEPLACLTAYELLAGHLVRGLGGRERSLPHAVREVEVARKLVSAVGCVDVCRVRLVAGRAEPVGGADEGGLAAAVRADGFVVIPAPLEGHAPGARVTVRLHRHEGEAP
jgi:molybdopterin molybdotransferase